MTIRIEADWLPDLYQTLREYRLLLITLYGNNRPEIEEVERQMKFLVQADNEVARRRLEGRNTEHITGFPYG